ncbi:hypothetical protein OHB14_51810 [Streptomyces sp. NBC_01613]|uniref:hypothetical protein n=1 Tax=Streptomyces sp. NBC_01613 TaxID=2975896 RepID=UPI00386E2280
MVEAVVTVVHLVIAAVCLCVGAVKIAAARSTPDTVLKITSSALLFGSVIYVMSAPAVYRAVGMTTGLPSLPSLIVYSMTFLGVGHAHLLTVLWHPRRRDGARRSTIIWGCFYATVVAAMTVLFFAGDPRAPARPLTYSTSYAHVPATLTLHLVYMVGLVIAVVATVRQYRGPDGVTSLPARPDISSSLRLFAFANGLVLVYVAGTAPAVIAASRGDHRLDFLAAIGSVAISSSALGASYGLARSALHARAAERRDHQALLPLWEAVTGQRRRGVGRWNSRYALTDLVVDLLDEIRLLHPWASGSADDAVRAEVQSAVSGSGHRSSIDASYGSAEGLDVQALTIAVAIQHARRLRERPDGASETDGHRTSASLRAWEAVPAKHQRAHLLKIASYLPHPLTAAALVRLASDSAERVGMEQDSASVQ